MTGGRPGSVNGLPRHMVQRKSMTDTAPPVCRHLSLSPLLRTPRPSLLIVTIPLTGTGDVSTVSTAGGARVSSPAAPPWPAVVPPYRARPCRTGPSPAALTDGMRPPQRRHRRPAYSGLVDTDAAETGPPPPPPARVAALPRGGGRPSRGWAWCWLQRR